MSDLGNSITAMALSWTLVDTCALDIDTFSKRIMQESLTKRVSKDDCREEWVSTFSDVLSQVQSGLYIPGVAEIAVLCL